MSTFTRTLEPQVDLYMAHNVIKWFGPPELEPRSFLKVPFVPKGGIYMHMEFAKSAMEKLIIDSHTIPMRANNEERCTASALNWI